MPKRLPEDEIKDLLSVIAGKAGGASIEQIMAGVSAHLPRRTVQHRLLRLVEQHRLVRHGRGPATRYMLPTPAMGTVPDTVVPLSPEALEIQRYIRRPIQVRMPVGYMADMLEAYTPNETFYLPLSTRSELHEYGRSVEGQTPAGTYVKTIYNRLLIDLSWNSSRLEGNTFSLLETERLLELGHGGTAEHARDAQMILNHKAAIDMLIEQQEDVGFNRYTILNLHGLLSYNLMADVNASARLRTRPVGVSGTVFHPLEVPQRIEECFDIMLATASAIIDPFEQAFFIMVQLPYLQPFEDVNKRVSRLAANIPFIRENLSPLSFVDVPLGDYIEGLLGIYELNRIELLRDVFVWAYKRSSLRYSAMRRSLGEPDIFRLRYRNIISETIAAIVRNRMNRETAVAFIRNQATEHMPPESRQKFIEVVDIEIMSLHEGTIAIYRLRLHEYHAWRERWQ